jgi:hypothetical protein
MLLYTARAIEQASNQRFHFLLVAGRNCGVIWQEDSCVWII